MKITKTELASMLKEGIGKYYTNRNKRHKIGRLVKEELSKAQKELDLDDDGSIEASDLKGLRGGKKDKDVGKEKKKVDERITRLVQEEYLKALSEDANGDIFEMVDAVVDEMGADKALDNIVQAMEPSAAQELLVGILQDYGIPFGHGDNAVNEETKPHEADRHPADTPKDRIRLEEGNEASKLIDALGKVGEAIKGATGNLSDDPSDTEAMLKAMPKTLETLEAAQEQVQQIWEAMHDMLEVNEETKPHEDDRKPVDTPEDRIRK
jgi:hypothetical protein